MNIATGLFACLHVSKDTGIVCLFTSPLWLEIGEYKLVLVPIIDFGIGGLLNFRVFVGSNLGFCFLFFFFL